MADCENLTNPTNGTVTFVSTAFGSTANYSCNSIGYILIGMKKRTCQEDGIWSGSTPTCEGIYYYIS